ncbi:MAG: N-6 DNA methylase [Thermoleophilia bacterium]|nr:N-6 DNA methylase [Thermoleophilia bacterium]
MAQKKGKRRSDRLEALAACLDEQAGRYRSLRAADDFGAYLAAKADRGDEEVLTEPILERIIERVLGFPTDAYFPQKGKSGLKPDFTPDDLIAHSFVLDAKGSDQKDLRLHEHQIRRYMTQRSLRYGVLFNLREVRVYRAGAPGSDPRFSFSLLPLWQIARGEALPTPGDLEAFEAFCGQFAYRPMGLAEKIEHVRDQQAWAARLRGGDPVEVDVEYLVAQLRRLSRTLADDVAAQPELLDASLELNPDRESKLVKELELLALDVAPGIELASLPTTIAAWRSEQGLPERVWRQYCLRVGYLALTRILLYRAWEDVGFVDEYLYDGGFGDAYDRLSENVRAILREAFLHGAEKYRWLYGPDNNYDWYRPREDALVDVLYALAPFPLGKLNADVLGGLYVSYVDEIDRDRLGQFFTPRAVVSFMLDRAGFRGAEGVFRLEGDRREPRRIFDFATGSGGFLVEAARRVIDDGGIDQDDPRALREALRAIVTGFVGGEISPFPYYLTEVNLLLQVSRLVGGLTLKGEAPSSFVLRVLHVDSLVAKHGARSFDEIEPEHRADRADLMRDDWFDLVPLDGEKLAEFRRLHDRGGFDLVVGNPPYVAESNNRPLFERLRSIPAWKGIYRGKTDYLYYFLLLAVEKLAPGGRLCVITPAGWMNAGAAGFLRETMARELRLDELFLFGSHKLFAEDQGPAATPTVESAILVATKGPAPRGHKLRIVALEDEAEAARALSGDPQARAPDRQALLDEIVRRAAGKPGRVGGIHVHDVPQNELVASRPWPIKHNPEDLAARVVAHLESALKVGPPFEPLQRSWKTFLGIQTGADAYSRKIQERLSAEARRRLEAEGLQLGDPVYALPPGLEARPPWDSNRQVLVRSPEPEAVLYGTVDEGSYVSLVWLTQANSPPPPVLAAVERWRPLLAERAEFKRNPRREWWETCWPRSRDDLSAPKVIALHRTDRGRFALDETGAWSPSGRMSVVVGRGEGAPVAYLCGLLNSELLDLWYAVRGRTPWHVRRDYEPKPMNEIPYRRPGGDARAERVAELVRLIAANRRALLPHRDAVRDLGRIVKDPWRDGPVEFDRGALVRELPEQETISVRVDPSLMLSVTSGPFGKPRRQGSTLLALVRGSAVTATLAGPAERLDLVEELLGGKAPGDLPALLLPRDLERFEQLAAGRAGQVRTLLDEGRRLVEEVERLVCALYGLPDALTEEVVQHAVRRAAR